MNLKPLMVLPIAGALLIAQPAPKAEAFFVLPIVAAAAMFGAFGTGALLGGAAGPGLFNQSPRCYDPQTGQFYPAGTVCAGARQWNGHR